MMIGDFKEFTVQIIELFVPFEKLLKSSLM